MPPDNSDVPDSKIPDIRPVMTFAGAHHFRQTRWTEHCWQQWVLDLILQGRQVQRVAGGRSFLRSSGVLALYAPGTRFFEKQTAGRILYEASFVFTASASVETMLRRLAGRAGYCHIQDPDDLVGGLMQRLAEQHRRSGPGGELVALGIMLEIIGLLPSSTDIAPRLRRLAPQSDPGQSLIRRVADYLEAHLDRPVRVADLAAAAGMSESAFAHAYRRAKGQTPYQAILHSKISAARRLLLSERLNVQQTAARLGFASAFGFSRTFKKVEGYAPRNYVRRLTGASSGGTHQTSTTGRTRRDGRAAS